MHEGKDKTSGLLSVDWPTCLASIMLWPNLPRPPHTKHDSFYLPFITYGGKFYNPRLNNSDCHVDFPFKFFTEMEIKRNFVNN